MGAEHDARLAQVIKYLCDRHPSTSVCDYDDSTVLAVVDRGTIHNHSWVLIGAAPYRISTVTSP